MKNKTVNRSVFWGAVLILAALLLILDGAGFSLAEGFGAFRMIAAVLFAAWFIYDLIRLRFARVFFPLAFLFITVKPLVADALGKPVESLISSWLVLLAALLLTVGVNLILPKNDHTKSPNTRKIGNSTMYIYANDPQTCTVAENLGNVKVYTVNRDEYTGGGTIEVCGNLGDVTIYLPASWTVNAVTSDNLGYVYIPKQDADADRDKIITLNIHDNLGRVQVVFD